LQKLTARGNVRATSDKGDVATGDLLVVTMAYDGTPQVELTGKTATGVEREGDGADEHEDRRAEPRRAAGAGAGTLVAPVEDNTPSAKPRMMNVSWTARRR
jgi:hypothetical protein